MRWALIIGVLIVTALTFFSATRSVPSQLQDRISSEIAALAPSEEQELLASQVSDLQSELQDQSAQIATLTADRDRLDQELQDAIAGQEAAEATLAGLSDNDSDLEQLVSTLTTEKADIESQLLAVETELGDAETALAAATAELGEAETKLVDAETRLADAEAERATLSSALEDERKIVRAHQDLLVVAGAQADTLSERIANLEAGTVTTPADNDAVIGEMQATLDETSTALAAAEEQITALTEQVDQQAETAAAMTERATTAEENAAALDAEIASLTTAISERDANIAELDASIAELSVTEEVEPANIPTVESCTETTTAIFAEEKINFQTGTANIAEESAALLQELATAARACVDAGLIVEIGGHTDSQGGEQSNQILSEARARAVFDLLFAGGVPSVAMRATGFGESDPIADNNTSEGRSENRRITFDWQQQ